MAAQFSDACPPARGVAGLDRTLLHRWSTEGDAANKFVAWNFARKDSDLWYDDGDCLVYLYGKAQSRRGASFCVPTSLLVAAECTTLLTQVEFQDADSVEHADDNAQLELYLPAPPGLSREDTFRYHLTTRNFFAWACAQPLVGQHLGPVLFDLLRRMPYWRKLGLDHGEDLLVYTDVMGYSVVSNAPDHALAMLHLAEASFMDNVWLDAFVHCVGMSESLRSSSEYEPVSKVTRALITRASLEMDLHLERSSRALSNILEEQMSASRLDLSTTAREHLERFRSFLYSFCVSKFGYWPLLETSQFPKEQYRTLYHDFRQLYGFLADKDFLDDSHTSEVSKHAAVQRNIKAFNSRHHYESLPYTLPLLPQESPEEGSRKVFFQLRIGGKESRAISASRVVAQLQAASNMHEEEVLNSHLVQKFMEFEADEAHNVTDHPALVEARTVRWMLVYGVLQTLISMLQAPPEVRDTDAPVYPLCVLTAGILPWDKTSMPSLPQRSTERTQHPLESSQEGTPMRSDNEDVDYFRLTPSTSSSSYSSDAEDAPAEKKAQKHVSMLQKPSLPLRSSSRRAFGARPSSIPTFAALDSSRSLAELAHEQTDVASTNNDQTLESFGFDFDPVVDEEPVPISLPARSSRRKRLSHSTTVSVSVPPSVRSDRSLQPDSPSSSTGSTDPSSATESGPPSLIFSRDLGASQYSASTPDSDVSSSPVSFNSTHQFPPPSFATDTATSETPDEDEGQAPGASFLQRPNSMLSHHARWKSGLTYFTRRGKRGVSTDWDSNPKMQATPSEPVVLRDGSIYEEFVDAQDTLAA